MQMPELREAHTRMQQGPGKESKDSSQDCSPGSSCPAVQNPTNKQSRESQLVGNSKWARGGAGEVHGGEGGDEGELGEDAVQSDGAGEGLPADEGSDVQNCEEQGGEQPYSSQELA